jgi:hypothetical protein
MEPAGHYQKQKNMTDEEFRTIIKLALASGAPLPETVSRALDYADALYKIDEFVRSPEGQLIQKELKRINEKKWRRELRFIRWVLKKPLSEITKKSLRKLVNLLKASPDVEEHILNNIHNMEDHYINTGQYRRL